MRFQNFHGFAVCGIASRLAKNARQGPLSARAKAGGPWSTQKILDGCPELFDGLRRTSA